MTASLRIQSSKADPNTCESFTRSGLKLESVHQESPRSDVFRKRATKPLLNQRQRQKRLTWAVEKKISVVQSPLSDENKFCISFGNKVPESGGRVERHRFHVAWSPVWSFHSQWWFGLPRHLLVFSEVHSQRRYLPGNFRALYASFCWQLYGDADFIFQQDLAPAHTAKGTKSWFNDHGVTVLDWPANSPDLNPIENLWGIVKRKMRDTRPNNADDLKATVKETWASIPPQQCHKLITSMPRRIEAVIKAKGAPTKYWVHIQ